MQAVEALNRLIAVADQYAPKVFSDQSSPEDRQEGEQNLLAISVAQAMLNTALPVARWRCFVQYESGKEEGREFTICAVNIEDIVAALYPLSTMVRKVYITLWEQRPTGADMVQGFQGWTHTPAKKKALRQFLDSLRQYSVSSLAN
jgi:hypothetical protein